MSAIEINRIKARIDNVEATMQRMVAVMERIEQMYDGVEARRAAAEQRHKVMMQEKSDAMRAGTLAEIKANMSIVKRDILTQLREENQI